MFPVKTSSPEASQGCLRPGCPARKGCMACGNVLRLWALEESVEDPVCKSCIPSRMEPLMFKGKSRAGKARHEWKRGFLVGVGFPTFLFRPNTPRPRWKTLSDYSLGRTGFRFQRGFQPESPRPEPNTDFPPPYHPRLSPGASQPQQESCQLLQAPRRHPQQGVLPERGAGEARRMGKGEWHGPGIHINSTTYVERHALNSALSK